MRDLRVEVVVLEHRARRVVVEHPASAREVEDGLELGGARIAAEGDDLPGIHP